MNKKEIESYLVSKGWYRARGSKTRWAHRECLQSHTLKSAWQVQCNREGRPEDGNKLS